MNSYKNLAQVGLAVLKFIGNKKKPTSQRKEFCMKNKI